MNHTNEISVIGKSVKIHGDVTGTEDMVFDGELEGSIQVPGGKLTLGPTARVRAHIVAQDVIVYGRLEGDIHAIGRVELRTSAMMQGDIFAGGLSIEQNAAFRGRVDPTRAHESISVAEERTAEARTVPPTPMVVTPLAVAASTPATAPQPGYVAAANTSYLPLTMPSPSGAPRTFGQYPAALAAAAAAAAARPAQAAEAGAAEEATEEPTLIFAERKS